MKNNDYIKTEIIVSAIDESHKTAEKVQERKNTKRFRKITHPLTLEEGLTRLTKEELHLIRKRLDIKKASGLKKGELISLLEKKIPEFLEEYCTKLDDTRYKIIKEFSDRNGIIPLPDLHPHQLDYWLSCGMIFSGEIEGKKVLVMPKEILERFSQLSENRNLIKTIKRNTEWIKLTQGLLYYYGTLTVSQIFDFLENKYLNDVPNHFKYFTVVYDAVDYHKNILMEADYWSNPRVTDSKKVIEERQKRKKLSFYPFSKEQLLLAGEAGYRDKDISYLELADYLFQHFGIKIEKAESLVEECVYATKNGESPVNILTFLQNYIEVSNIDTLRKLTEKVINLMNHTREWFLKGHRSVDIMQEEGKTLKPLPSKKTKIGRNEPCPCGSNKKYKKCCGR